MIIISERTWKTIEIQSKKVRFKNPSLRLNLNNQIIFEELCDRNTDTHIFGPSGTIVVINKKNTEIFKNSVLIYEKESFKIIQTV